MEAILNVISQQSFWTVAMPRRSGEWWIASWKWRLSVESGDCQLKWGSPVQSGESPVQSGDRQFKVAIASSKWRIASSKWRSPVQSGESPIQSGELPVQSGESPVQSGDPQFKVAITSSKWRSPIQSGNNQFQVAIASSKWRIASSKIYINTMALNGHRTNEIVHFVSLFLQKLPSWNCLQFCKYLWWIWDTEAVFCQFFWSELRDLNKN